MPTDPADVQSLFLAALERPGSERDALLAQACGNDTALRQRVEALLKAYDEPGSFLDAPPAALVNLRCVEETVVEKAGTMVGPYKLLEQLGEGGMGVVYVAEQHQPVRRKVALKVIKPGMDTRQVIARFEAERQALALMDHPSIAKVLDAGSTEGGRPYFVMELVKGVSIIDYCDQCNLTTRERLELFIAVCQAVQHAHQKGIIHRDLKPSNVLIAMQDGKPTPKIIDFGVAKAINQRLTEQTLQTGYAQILGTPLYMSPEQAELSPLDVDTRSDIYSLGVLLYELLCGSTPFDKQRLSQAGFDELRRIIREEEPAQPSHRLSTLHADALSTIAEHRRVDPKKLTQLVRGDLDWIVMRCLEKDRSRRYETANGLARDIQRHLNDEPVEARPPSVAYKFSKFTRRNRAALATATLVAAVLVLAAAGLAASNVQISRERAKAIQERNATAVALNKEARARQVAEELQEIADQQRRTAERLKKLARQEKALAEQREQITRRYLYVAHMNLAQQAMELTDPARALRLLNFHHPEPGQEDLRGFEWYYWWAQCHRRLLRSLDGHSNLVRSIAFSPDGQTLVSGSRDRTVKLWDVASGLERTSFTGHVGDVTSLALSPDGKTLASGSWDRTVKLWDVATSKLLATLKGHKNFVLSVAFSPDGRTLASGSKDQTTKLWDVSNGMLKRTLEGHTDHVNSVAFAPGGESLASASNDGTVKLWNVTTGELSATLGMDGTRVYSVAFSPNGETLAAAVYVLLGDGVVKLWDVSTGKLKATLEGHKAGLFAVAFSRDGKLVSSAGEDRTVKVWDVATGELKLSLAGHGHYVNSVAFSPDGKTLASASHDHTVKLWDAAGNEPKTLLTSHANGVQSVAFSPDGQTVASGSIDQTIKLWDVDSGELKNTLQGHAGRVGALAISPDGRTLASASHDKTVKLWDLATGKAKLNLEAAGYEYGDSPVAFSPDGQTVASASDGHTIKLWDAGSGALKATLKAHRSPVLSLAFSPDGKTLASAGAWDLTARLWDVATGKLQATLRGHSMWVWAVAFSPDGKTLASASEDQTIKLWDVATGKLKATLAGHAAVVWSLAFSHEGKTLASASYDKTIKLWDLATGEPKSTLQYDGGIRAVAFSPDGTILASGNGDGTVKLWRAATEQEVLARSKFRPGGDQ